MPDIVTSADVKTLMQAANFAAFRTSLSLGALATITPGTGVATFLTTPSSANLAAAVTGETGTGALVFGSSPTIDAPTLTGTTTAATVNATTGNVTTLVFGGTTITATGAQLNFVTGVTSAIQTQLDAKQALDSDLTSWAAITRASGFDTFVATPSGANLGSLLTSALTVAKGGTGITAFGTGVATALGVNVGSAGAFVAFNGALGTPSSGSGANLTALSPANIAAGILGANITLGESTGQILLDPTLSADGTWSGIMEAGTAGATLAFGDVVYLAVADSRWELTDADAAATSGPVKIGICVLAAAADGDPTNILLFGKIRADAAFPTFTVSAPVFLSGTAGDVTNTAPSATDSVTRIVGYGNTGDVLFWCPDPTWITHT